MAEILDTPHIYEFGPFRMDERQGSVSRGGRSIFLRPKAYALLLQLARNVGRVVPKDELMDAVWPGIFVTEDSLTQNIREIRKAFGDAEQALIRTVTKRGYMLAPSLEPITEQARQPIVAVFRFRNEAGTYGDGTDESIVDGFAEDIINGLSRFGSVTVLARTSSFAFASYAQPEWSAVAARIGADYIVEGSIRRAGDRAQISVNLVDAAKSLQLWGERYEAKDVGLFTVQQEIGEQIITRLVSRLDDASIRRSSVKPAANLAAYELVIRGARSLRDAMGKASGSGAKELFEQAAIRDPEYGLAYAYLALESVISGGLGSTAPDTLVAARQLAARCISLSPEQSIGHRVMSLVRLYQRQHAGAEDDLRRSLGLNPCDPDAINQMGYLMVMRGRAVEAIEWLEKAMRLNPLHPQWYFFDHALALYVLGEYDRAAEMLSRSQGFLAWTPMLLAACHARLGNEEAAIRAARSIATISPEFAPLDEARRTVAFENASDTNHLVEGVEMALKLAESAGAAR